MPIYQAGSINTTALVVPDLYVQIVPPQNLVLNGVPTNVIGVVGTATWGPVNQPVVIGTFQDYIRAFGSIVARKYDMATTVAVAVQQGAQAFRCVRVTDGTDVAATIGINYVSGSNVSVTLTARYTGTVGNTIRYTVSSGSAASTWRLTIGLPGQQPEVFDNISAPSPSAFWANVASAINNGAGPLRGPSQLVVATVGAGAGLTTAPAAATGALTGGTDGVSTITAATLVGADALPRTGMYALRGQGCSIGVLSDVDDTTQWTTIDGFGLNGEGVYFMQVLPAGTTNVSTAATAKATAGLDSYSSKLCHGDWVYWNDPVNQILRLVSPQGFFAGRLANLSPEQSSLNKPIYGVVATQKSGLAGSGQSASYSSAELAVLGQAGIDVITNPIPSGNQWGARFGHNSSSNAAVSGDNYTRLTNYIAATLNAGMGRYVGQLINVRLFQRAKATLVSFLNGLLGQGMLGSTDGSLPFSVVCDLSNNPDNRTSLGYLQADTQIKYQAINEKFIVNVEGGQTVQVSRQTTPAGQIAA